MDDRVRIEFVADAPFHLVGDQVRLVDIHPRRHLDVKRDRQTGSIIVDIDTMHTRDTATAAASPSILARMFSPGDAPIR